VRDRQVKETERASTHLAVNCARVSHPGTWLRQLNGRAVASLVRSAALQNKETKLHLRRERFVPTREFLVAPDV
jgi:hypothetical protein